MKVLVNGVINVSELDGWCAEAYTPEVGWALGDGREHGDDPAWDAAEAERLPSFTPETANTIERQRSKSFSQGVCINSLGVAAIIL
jgi:glucan phosphorylase